MSSVNLGFEVELDPRALSRVGQAFDDSWAAIAAHYKDSEFKDARAQVAGGYGSLQPIVLPLELFQAFGLINLEPTVLTPPLVVGLLRDPDAPADLACRLALLACPASRYQGLR